MPWMVTNHDRFDLFTDHDNLILLIGPMSIVLDMSQNTLCKVFCWAVRLGMYNCKYYHITFKKRFGKISRPASVQYK